MIGIKSIAPRSEGIRFVRKAVGNGSCTLDDSLALVESAAANTKNNGSRWNRPIS